MLLGPWVMLPLCFCCGVCVCGFSLALCRASLWLILASPMFSWGPWCCLSGAPRLRLLLGRHTARAAGCALLCAPRSSLCGWSWSSRRFESSRGFFVRHSSSAVRVSVGSCAVSSCSRLSVPRRLFRLRWEGCPSYGAPLFFVGCPPGCNCSVGGVLDSPECMVTPLVVWVVPGYRVVLGEGMFRVGWPPVCC